MSVATACVVSPARDTTRWSSTTCPAASAFWWGRCRWCRATLRSERRLTRLRRARPLRRGASFRRSDLGRKIRERPGALSAHQRRRHRDPGRSGPDPRHAGLRPLVKRRGLRRARDPARLRDCTPGTCEPVWTDQARRRAHPGKRTASCRTRSQRAQLGGAALFQRIRGRPRGWARRVSPTRDPSDSLRPRGAHGPQVFPGDLRDGLAQPRRDLCTRLHPTSPTSATPTCWLWKPCSRVARSEPATWALAKAARFARCSTRPSV